MEHTVVDIETYSSYPLKEVGAYRYAQAPDFAILLLSYNRRNGEVETIDLAGGDPDIVSGQMERTKQILFNPGIIKRAHNAAFEWWCLSQHFRLSQAVRETWISEWEDTELQALYCGLPGKLETIGEALESPEDEAKLKTGKQLIAYFCVPCKPTRTNGGRCRNLPQHDPKRWELFKEYNAQDVRAEQALVDRLAAWPVPDALMQEWRDDTIMNSRGIGVDRELVEGALACAQDEDHLLKTEAAQLTHLSNPNSNPQLAAWLSEQGVDLPNLRKETVAEAKAAGDLPESAERMLDIRTKTNKSSLSKYQTALDAIGDDDRIRGNLQFYGANRTGRWAGRLLQVQNLPRTHLEGQDEIRKIIKLQDTDALRTIYGDVKDTLSQMIRTILVPQGENTWFIDADFSAIEARLIAWEAGEEWALEEFRGEGKIYEATAARIFGIPKDSVRKGQPNYSYRQRGKVATLALGYQGSVGAMRRMDSGHALDRLSDGEVMDIVNRWRRGNPHITKLWEQMLDAATRTIETGQMSAVRRKVYSPRRAQEHELATHSDRQYSTFFNSGDNRPVCIFRLETSTKVPYPFLTMQLPSGRKLFYAKPSTTDNRRITYWEQTNAGWSQSETYGGKLTENMTQAIGRDCLAMALKGLRKAGYNIVFSVHDEVIAEVQTQDPEAELQKIVAIMRQPPVWAQDLPLNADGWYEKFYTKE